ncbi:MAG: Hsp20/alpha crystallin family protein [Phycisphaerae bacterium]
MTSTTSLEKREEQSPAMALAEPIRGGPTYRPSVDIVERPDELLVVADVPGVTAESVNVRYEHGELTLEAHVEPRQRADTSYLLREYGVGAFRRVFRLNETIDAEQISAEVGNGVLTLHLPKAESAKPRRIKVKSA